MEVIDTSSSITPAANLMLSIFTAFCENEMTIKKERMHRGKRAKIDTGHYVGGPILYGYAVDENKRFIPHPVDAENVRKIFTMYATGEWSLRALGMEFRDNGAFHTVRRESVLCKVAKTLKERRYTGCNPHYPQIISEELYNKCMSIKDKNITIQRPTNKHEMMGKGILRTKDNNYLMSCCSSKHCYIGRSEDNKPMSINQEYIDPVIWDISKRLYTKYVNNKELRQKRMLEEARQLYFKMKTADAEVQAVQEKIDRLEERIIVGSISHDKSDRMSQKLNDDLKAARAKYSHWYELYGNKLEQMKADYWEGSSEMYDLMTFDDKRNIVMTVIDHIYVSRPFPRSYRFILEVHTKFGDEFTKECRGRF